MFKRKKILLGLLSFIAISLFCLSNAQSQDLGGASKSGWDVIQENKNPDFNQDMPTSNTKDVSKRIYKEGDIEKGVINITGKFNEFPDEKIISIKLDGSDVKTVLQELAREGGKNIIIDNSVNGKITTDLDKVSINEAMDLILSAAELEARVVGDTIFIASKTSMPRKGLSRRVVKSFKLNYANAIDVASVLDASIFNKGFDIKTGVKELTESPSAKMAVAMQAQALPPINDSGESGPNGVGAPDQPPPGEEVPEAAGDQTSAQAKGSSTVGANRTVRTVDYTTDPANGFNDAKTIAGSVRIQGFKGRNATYSVNNNSGGAIAVPDSRTNSILVAGIEEDIYAAEKTIKYLDKPLKQVSIDVSLIEMARTDVQDLGLSFAGDSSTVSAGFNNPSNVFNRGNLTTPNGFEAVPSSNGPPFSTFAPVDLARSVGIPTVLGQNAIQLSTIKNLTKNVTARLNALIRKDKVKVVANPNIIAVDGSDSLIKLTSQIINRITTTSTNTSTTTSVELADVGIVLDILPKISDDGYITMRIRPSITSPGQTRNITLQGSSLEITLVDTREVIIGDVRIKSGETLAIGGLVSERLQDTNYKNPIISEIPIIGSIFRQTSKTKQKTELIILVTPKIIDDIANTIRSIKPGETLPIN